MASHLFSIVDPAGLRALSDRPFQSIAFAFGRGPRFTALFPYLPTVLLPANLELALGLFRAVEISLQRFVNGGRQQCNREWFRQDFLGLQRPRFG